MTLGRPHWACFVVDRLSRLQRIGDPWPSGYLESRPLEFWDLIKDIKIGMFTPFSSDGLLHLRPMTIQNRADDRHNKLWFLMSRNSEPVLDLARDPDVNVAYADPGSDAYISVAGRAAVFDDVQTKEDLWSTGAQAWFPGGPKDPEVAMVAVAIEHVEYWKIESNKMVQLVKHGEMRTA